MSHRLVVFDFDGTLADSFPWLLTVLDSLAEKFRFPKIGPDDVETLRGVDAHRVLSTLGISRWHVPRIARHVRTRMATEIAAIPLVAGIEQVFDAVSSQGAHMSVLSSNAEANVRAVLGAALSARMTHFECGVGIFGKTRRLRQLLRRANVLPDEAVYVGDEVRDLEAARVVGAQSVAVTWGYASEAALAAAAPTHLVRNVHELAALLANAPRMAG